MRRETCRIGPQVGIKPDSSHYHPVNHRTVFINCILFVALIIIIITIMFVNLKVVCHEVKRFLTGIVMITNNILIECTQTTVYFSV